MKGKLKNIVNFDGKWRPVGYMRMGCEEAKIFYHVFYIHWVASGKYENMPGTSQGILSEKMCQSVGILLAFPLVQLYGAGTVWSVLHLVSHIYSNKTSFMLT